MDYKWNFKFGVRKTETWVFITLLLLLINVLFLFIINYLIWQCDVFIFPVGNILIFVCSQPLYNRHYEPDLILHIHQSAASP